VKNPQLFLTIGHHTCNLPYYILSFSVPDFVTSIVTGNNVMNSYVNSITISPSTIEMYFCISYIIVYILTHFSIDASIIISVLSCYP
jgi:hypothetical protein